ncbi:MAG: hypothetical protein A2X28_01915 [Elusimicrobia bacterium GWA2_56_46]|nr:MAG: hypothetical protein A2X28_01915 [Elusimicrobia bacterium GWA2_56_46]OGR55473.1 MAG: hypothetical protein A2X39_01050 [Elusimicrobia bacterium GWC2_56_31]HBW21941.1 hypothetical protein [Elusimicrobiota bacterium]
MNAKGHYNNPKERLLGAALKAAALTAGLRGEIVQGDNGGRDCGPDATVVFTYGQKKYRYAVEVKAIDRVVGLEFVKAKFEKCELPVLLAAPYITAEMAEHCRGLGIQFIDTAGNAYIKAEGLHIFITGNKRIRKDMAVAKYRASTAAGMRVVFALLCKPELIDAPYRDVAAAAGVALGTVGWVFFALQNRGHLLIDKRKKRQFVDLKRVVEEWVVNYPAKLRPKLGAQRFHAPEADWWKKTRLKKYAALFGGEAAGDILTKYRHPGEVLIYLKGDPAGIILDNHLKADPEGEVEILEKFWNFDLETKEDRVVPPVLIYADLMATRDPRNHEIAKLVYDRYITNAYR